MKHNFLYFTATWCGPCRAFKPVLMETAQESGVNIQVMDIDHQADTADRFGIRAVPTLIVTDQSGNTLFRKTGAMPKSELVQLFSKFN